MKNAIYFLLAVCAVQTLQAGDKILNGGNVIVCGNNVELLDYYEARLTGKKLQFDPGAATYSEKLNQMFTRWEKVAPLRMGLYKEWLNEFESDAGIYPGIEIPEIQDTGTVAIPSGCKMIPAAFQRRDEDIFPGEKRYVINKDLWDLMSQDQKAGLVLHEIIYREAIKNGHPTSLPTRYFNGFLSTETNPENEKYFAVVYKMPLAWAEYSGMKVHIGEVYCNDGTFGNPGCSFNYRSKYGSDKEVIRFDIGEIFDKVVIGNLSAEFYNYPCTGSVSNSYETYNSEKTINFTGCDDLKSFYVKNRMNLTDIETDKKLRYSGDELVPYFNSGDYLIGVNSETSWFQHSTGERIENFKAFGRIEFTKIFLTKDDKIWSFSTVQNKFAELFFNTEFNKKNISCYMTLDSFKSRELQCPEIPQSFSCDVPVITPYLGSTGWEATTVKVMTKSLYLKSYPSSGETFSEYYVKIPKGQVTSFVKKRFGKLEAQRATKDYWQKISWSYGVCRLDNN